LSILSISPVTSSNPLYLPTLPVQAETNARSSYEQQQDLIQLSNRAKQLLSSSSQRQSEPPEAKDDVGKESVQISSSMGRLSRITGLQKEEVAALYRSIDKLT